MKKLLSILAVSGIVATSAPTAVACEESKIDLNMDLLNLYHGQGIYDDIKNDLAKQASVKISDIKSDTLIDIKIYHADGTAMYPTGTPSIANSVYDVKITISEGDVYFNPTSGELSKLITAS